MSFFKPEEAVEVLQSKHFYRNMKSGFVRFLIGWCFFYGIVVLILRQLRFVVAFKSWSLFGLLLAVLYAFGFAQKRRMSKYSGIAMIDAHNKAGGILLAGAETGDYSWQFRLKGDFSIPDIKLKDNLNSLSILLLSVLFLGASFYVPVAQLNDSSGRIDLSSKTAEIEKKVDLLEKEKIITQEEKKEFDLALENIVANSDKNSPGITFEALDQIQNKLYNKVDTEVKKRITDINLLKKLESFAKDVKSRMEKKAIDEELAKASGTSSYGEPTAWNPGENASTLMEQLKNMLRKEGLGEEQINNFLKEQFGGTTASESLSEEEIASYARQLGDNVQKKLIENSDLIEKLMDEKLKRDLGLSDGADGKGKGTKEGETPSLGQEQEGGNSLEKGALQEGKQGGGKENSGEIGRPGLSNTGKGKFSVGSGKGGYGLSFGDKASDHNVIFHDEKLPDARLESSSEAINVGVGFAAPRAEKYTGPDNEEPSAFGSKSSVSGINREIILPKYRNTVKKYFEH